MDVLKEYVVLDNGVKLPKIGLGTYKLQPGDETYNTVKQALKLGVRHLDTAIIYQNELSVGEAIKDSGIPREEIFITSKVPPHIKNKSGTRRMFEKSLKNLGLDYIDLYIINAPGPFNDLDGNYDQENIEVYKTLEELYHEERVFAIGVSQFKIKDLENIISNCTIVPHVQQIAYFIGHTQDELVNFCKHNNIQIQAFSPLAKGYLLNHPTITRLANKYAVTAAQLALRYIIQNGIAPIPKAKKLEHIKENTELNFIINDQDIHILDSIIDDPRQYDDPI